VQRFEAFGRNCRGDWRMLKMEVKNNTKMIIYEMFYLPVLLYGSEIWTVLTRCDSRIAGAEMRYFSKQEDTE
jgi:hypothetical protein